MVLPFAAVTGAAAETEARRAARLREIEDVNRRLEELHLHISAVRDERQVCRLLVFECECA